MRLSVQLYTVRDALAEDYVGTLKKLKDIGLEYVEGAGNYGGARPRRARRSSTTWASRPAARTSASTGSSTTWTR